MQSVYSNNAAEASDAELAEDIRYLKKAWKGVRERSFKSPPGTLLHQDLSLAQRVLRDLADDRTQTIRIDSRMQFEELSKFGREFTPGAVGKLQHYAGERPIFDLFAIDEEIAKALLRRVELKSGGYLVIDQTEALMAVDVNTGGFVGASPSTTPPSGSTSRRSTRSSGSCGCGTSAGSSSSTSST